MLQLNRGPIPLRLNQHHTLQIEHKNESMQKGLIWRSVALYNWKYCLVYCSSNAKIVAIKSVFHFDWIVERFLNVIHLSGESHRTCVYVHVWLWFSCESDRAQLIAIFFCFPHCCLTIRWIWFYYTACNIHINAYTHSWMMCTVFQFALDKWWFGLV